MGKRLFTFVEFLNEGVIYETKDPGYVPTREQIEKILELQAIIGEKYKKKFPKKSDFKAYLEELDTNPATAGKPAAGGRSLIEAYISLDVYNSITEDGKKERVIQGIQNAFSKKGIKQDEFEKAIKKLESISRDPENYKFSIAVGEKKGEFKIVISQEKEGLPQDGDSFVPDVVYDYSVDVIDPEKASYFFKNNMYKIDESNLGNTFEDPEYVRQVLDNIDEIVEKSFAFYNRSAENKKSTGIKSINIRTSCSRYRNLGPAEDLSWADLAYRRAGVFASYIAKTAKEISGDNQDFVEILMGVVFIDYLGSNGDGTSGPDPDKNQQDQIVRKGYYVKEGTGVKFIDKKEGGLLDIDVVEVTPGQNNQPILGSSAILSKAKDENGNLMNSLPASPEEYDKFKYIFIEVTGDESISPSSDTFPGDELPDEYTKVVDYSVRVKFPSGQYNGGGGGGKKKRRSSISRRELKKMEKRRKENSKFGCEWHKDSNWIENMFP